MKDCLGSVRSVVDLSDGTVLEQNDYYAFGERVNDSTQTMTSLNRWRYNAKEEQDPMAAKYPHLSPYNFCRDNPVNFVDPEGKDWFQNIITGELYYNANYTIDDTGKGPMHGDKSWIYLTNNNGFRSNNKDSDLLPFSSNYSDGEALFSSKEAERVISGH